MFTSSTGISRVAPSWTHANTCHRGYEHDSCGLCKQCLTGTEIYCPQRAMYAGADLDQGSFASHAVWREAFLFPIPDELSDEDAAPLMCGGATVWSALTSYNCRPTETVGVFGVGGLGHLAIQFCAKFGCRVVVLSGSDRKKDESLRLGAHEFVATKDAKELKVSHKLDRLLVTTSAQPDWNLIMPLMNPGSTIHPLSVSGGDFSIPYMPFISQGITVQGSVVASRQIHKDMITFSALHKITPVVEEFPMTEEGIEQAMAKLEKGDVRFRAVLKPQ